MKVYQHNKMAVYQDNLIILGGFFGTMFAITKVCIILIKKKYMNHQAENVLQYEERRLNFSQEEVKKTTKKFSCLEWFKSLKLSAYCCLKTDHYKAHLRLGRKISYLSLYQYCHVVDKHEK